MRIHGEGYWHNRTPEYIAWCNMIQRCLDPSHPQAKDYSGRGIAIDPAWRQYENFLADMGRKPSRKHTLERVNNNGSYCKANCIWATRTKQGRNQRTTKLSIVDAQQIRQLYGTGLTQQTIAGKFGVSREAISAVVTNRNWK